MWCSVLNIESKYKANLKKFLSNYEENLKNVSERFATWKELHTSGVISRREYETSVTEITEARVEVDELRKQVATVDVSIAEAKQQPLPGQPRSNEIVDRSHIPASWR